MRRLKVLFEGFLCHLVCKVANRKKIRMGKIVSRNKAWKSNSAHLEKCFYSHCLRPVRKYVFGKLGQRFGHFSSIWEFGASTGFNLFLIEKNYPQFKELIGYDVDQNAVDVGNKIAKESKSRVILEHANLTERIEEFDDKSVDIVLSHGFLVTQSDEQIRRLIGHFIRIARVGVLLVERNSFNEYDFITARDDINTFNYEKFLINNPVTKNRFSIEKLPDMELLNTEIDINASIFIHTNDSYFEPDFELLDKQYFNRSNRGNI